MRIVRNRESNANVGLQLWFSTHTIHMKRPAGNSDVRVGTSKKRMRIGIQWPGKLEVISECSLGYDSREYSFIMRYNYVYKY